MKDSEHLFHQVVPGRADRFVEDAEEVQSRPESFAERWTLVTHAKSGQTLIGGSEPRLPASHDLEEGWRRHHPLLVHEFHRVHPSCRTMCRCDAPPA